MASGTHRLSLLGGENRLVLAKVLLDDGGDLVKHLGTLVSRLGGPRRERGASGCDSFVELNVE